MHVNIKKDISLSHLTTLQVGGPARHFLLAEDDDDVIGGLLYASQNGLPVFVLGGGSNVLIADRGFDGLVIQVANRGIEHNDTLVTAAAGEPWDAVVADCVRRGLAGLECLSGIPGFVGGTPVQNVGAYGQEVSETIRTVRCFDTKRNEFIGLTKRECGFAYRTSIFNSTERDRYIVLSVTYELRRGGDARIVYKDLVDHFDGRKPTLIETREAVLKIRRAKSMVIDPADPNSKSAGSFFKNPVVGRARLNEIEAEFGSVPHFEFRDKVKIPAAWLIEHAGFYKGYVHGNAGISSTHTLALINRGRATAAEIVELKDKIQASVGARFGVELQTEPVMIGF